MSEEKPEYTVLTPGEPYEEEVYGLLREAHQVAHRIARVALLRDEAEEELREASESFDRDRVRRVENCLSLYELEYRSALNAYKRLVSSMGGEGE